MKGLVAAAVLACASLWAARAHAETLWVGAFNVASPNIPNAKPVEVEKLVEEFRLGKFVHLWAVEEVLDASWTERFRAGLSEASGDPYEAVSGTTGGGDGLAVIWNAGKLRKLGSFELIDMIQEGCGKKKLDRFRAPLVVRFEMRETGKPLWYAVNHLQRTGDPAYRACQARMLHDWAVSGTAKHVPVIMGGDFNLDFDVAKGDQGVRGAGSDALVKDGAWTWLRPATLRKTECSAQFNSVLDFHFANAKAAKWPYEAKVLRPEEVYCTTESKGRSDHRPIVARIEVE